MLAPHWPTIHNPFDIFETFRNYTLTPNYKVSFQFGTSKNVILAPKFSKIPNKPHDKITFLTPNFWGSYNNLVFTSHLPLTRYKDNYLDTKHKQKRELKRVETKGNPYKILNPLHPFWTTLFWTKDHNP